MADPKEMYDNDGVEMPRMTGDSADQLFDDDTMQPSAVDGNTGFSQERRGGSGGLSSGTSQAAPDLPFGQ